MDGIVNAKVSVKNLPDKPLGTGYLVVRACNLMLWYYGFYDSFERALLAADEIGNGIVLGVDAKEMRMGTIEITNEIPKEEYDKAMTDGARSLISDAIHMGYGVYSAKVYEVDGKYYLTYTRGSSCD